MKSHMGSLILLLGCVFILSNCKKEESNVPTLPVLTTKPVTQITGTTAWSGGEISSDGCSSNGNSISGCMITANGLVWSTSPGPTVALATKTDTSPGFFGFDSQMTGLTEGTTYYVRAYSTNMAGTAYGQEETFVATAAIGDEFQGGILAYILQPGDPGYSATTRHGLICSKEDVSFSEWSLTLTSTGATASVLGSGQANTTAIVANQGVAGNFYAARIADEFSAGGGTYTDWYLPSADELELLYANRVAIGNFNANYYWSSTELDANSALRVDFFSGSIISNGKLNSHALRPVRGF